jgi:hypothetical protein
MEIREEGVFPVPRDSIWKLLDAHLDDGAIGRIHPLLKGQKTISRSSSEALVDRWTDVRGKVLRSRWKVTLRSPDLYRWEIVDGEGPWATGNFLENTYEVVPKGTLVRTRGELKIRVLPFFIPQKALIRNVLDQLDTEDLAFLSASSAQEPGPVAPVA